MNGALLVRKERGVTSFGVIEALQRLWMEAYGVKRRDVPKMGHGGTLDPFATGLLVVGIGRGVKLARYLQGSDKIYEGTMAFGRTTIPGDNTETIIETSPVLPESAVAILEAAEPLLSAPYAQIPPMHSAVKVDGKRLYEFAHQGLEIERAPRICHLRNFEIMSYSDGLAEFRLECSSGTYVRQFAQDLGRRLRTVAMLDRLHRTGSGRLRAEHAMTLTEFAVRMPALVAGGDAPDTAGLLGGAWIEFDAMVSHLPSVEATAQEKQALIHGQQEVLAPLVARAAEPSHDVLSIFHASKLVAIARRDGDWGIERVFVSNE